MFQFIRRWLGLSSPPPPSASTPTTKTVLSGCFCTVETGAFQYTTQPDRAGIPGGAAGCYRAPAGHPGAGDHGFRGFGLNRRTYGRALPIPPRLPS